MDIIEISPPKNLRFALPADLLRTLTLTNLTLRSLALALLPSHPHLLALSHPNPTLSAFEELKLQLALAPSQQALNPALAKLRVYYYEFDDEPSEGAPFEHSKAQFEDINILYDLHPQVGESRGEAEGNRAYLLQRRLPEGRIGSAAAREKLKNEVLNYLQQLENVVSIEECERSDCFVIEFRSAQPDTCEFITFTVEEQAYVYSLARIVANGNPISLPTLVTITSDDPPVKPDPKQNEEPLPPVSPPPLPVGEEGGERRKKEAVKQSFAVRREGEKVRTKRRNKSQEKIQERSSEQSQGQQQMRRQLRSFRLATNFQVKPQVIKIKREVIVQQRNIELSEKVLGVLVEQREQVHYIYVLLRDCVRVFALEEPGYKRVLKFDAIDPEHTGMPCPLQLYKEELIFGNESYLFWVNTSTGSSEWKYVQRKYIYALAVIEELSLVALGGKNFSKLSYFGKETSRSNIKLYSCSASDKHDHLFTYDIPGSNVGHVINMDYVSAPPHATRLLLLHTLNPHNNKSSFFFLRVKAFNKIEVYCELELDELGILSLLKFKHNPATGRIVCMEALGEAEVDAFKKLKVRCQYEKVEVSTEGFKLPLRRYISFHLGGGREGEWMSLVEDNGCTFHLYDFEAARLTTLQLGKGQIRQVFPLRGGKCLLLCSDSAVRIREEVEREVRE